MKGAEQIYQCKPDLKRFPEKDIAFKKVSEDLGAPWMQLWFKNMLANVKESKIGKNVPVKSPKRLGLTWHFGWARPHGIVSPDRMEKASKTKVS